MSKSGISTLYRYCGAGSNHLCQGSECCLSFLNCYMHTDSPHFSTALSGYSLSRGIGFLLSAVQDPLNQSYTLLQSFPPRPGLSIPLLSSWCTSVYRLEILLSLFMCLDHSNLEKATLIQTAVPKWVFYYILHRFYFQWYNWYTDDFIEKRELMF